MKLFLVLLGIVAASLSASVFFLKPACPALPL
jgi:hypothetical protein